MTSSVNREVVQILIPQFLCEFSSTYWHGLAKYRMLGFEEMVAKRSEIGLIGVGFRDGLDLLT